MNADEGKGRDEMSYEKPVIRDYGDLVELTAAVSVLGNEDGASKHSLFHNEPSGV